jgi:hypothetical protein
MPAIRGFLRLGTSYSDHFVPAPAYAATPFEVSNVEPSFAVPRITGHRRSSDGYLTHGAVYTSDGDDGICLMMWPWAPPHTQVGDTFPSCHCVVSFEHRLQLALNASALGEPVRMTIEAGETFGAVDQQPLRARGRLEIRDGMLAPVAGYAMPMPRGPITIGAPKA